MHTEMAGTFHLMVHVKFLFPGSDGMRFCSSLLSFPQFQIPGPVNWIPTFTSPQLPTSPFPLAPFNFSFFSIPGWGIGLDYCDIEWIALEMNRDHSIVFEIASKY